MRDVFSFQDCSFHVFLSQQGHYASTAPAVAMDVLEIPLVGVGPLWHGGAIAGAVPRSVDVGGVPNNQSLAVVDENLKLCRLTTSDGTETIVLLFVGSEDIGRPYRTYLGVEPNGGVGAAVIAVAGVERDGDSVRQWMVELATGAFAI